MLTSSQESKKRSIVNSQWGVYSWQPKDSSIFSLIDFPFIGYSPGWTKPLYKWFFIYLQCPKHQLLLQCNLYGANTIVFMEMFLLFWRANWHREKQYFMTSLGDSCTRKSGCHHYVWQFLGLYHCITVIQIYMRIIVFIFLLSYVAHNMDVARWFFSPIIFNSLYKRQRKLWKWLQEIILRNHYIFYNR